MIIVGLTGGIGSGKSTVLNLFKQKGIPCYIADVEAKRLMNSSRELREKIISSFGESAYIEGVLNKKYLSDIVFSNKEQLKLLNEIVHPIVEKDFDEFVVNSKGDYIIYESAIIFENNSQDKFQYIITVAAPVEERIKRVTLRDNSPSDLVKDRIKNQLTDDIKISKSDYVIYNSGSLSDLDAQVADIHDNLLFLRK